MDACSNNGRIMIGVVDDEQMLLNVFSVLFKRSEEYCAECFSSPTEMLQKVTQEPGRYRMIISDIRMPEMDGLALAKKIREVNPQMPILFMSGYTSEEVRTEASSLGRVSFMDKPFSFEAVLKEVVPNFLKSCGVI